MDILTPLKLKNLRISSNNNPLSLTPLSESNIPQKKSRKHRTQQLIFSKLPLNMKKQFLHILRTNDIEFKPSIRNGFVEAKIRMIDSQSGKSESEVKSRTLVIGKEQYRKLLGHKYGQLVKKKKKSKGNPNEGNLSL